ncbi:Hypothetical protein PHPALM_17063 [Phytophthora palmivora]|uniref:Uncharacterized protein n=1 Tax=Phytophthora palmivora TaxID=4796 RepID=A0A2P4XN67_9STRA|nr:Hypothetical protein PHPALM_17063 [Phytophthora palmivora]
MTDASDIGWNLIVTQVSDWKSGEPAHHQQHQLLTCLSGTFTGSQLHWSIIEEEAYPIKPHLRNRAWFRGKELHSRKIVEVGNELAEYRYEIKHIPVCKVTWSLVGPETTFRRCTYPHDHPYQSPKLAAKHTATKKTNTMATQTHAPNKTNHQHCTSTSLIHQTTE